MLVRIEAEITLPDGTVFHRGDVADTKKYPMLEYAIAAVAAIEKDKPQETRLRMK
jgi:hypothetical protein